MGNKKTKGAKGLFGALFGPRGVGGTKGWVSDRQAAERAQTARGRAEFRKAKAAQKRRARAR